MNFFFHCAFFWDPCRNITTPSQCMTGFLCRAIFRVCAEILIFGEIYTSAILLFQGMGIIHMMNQDERNTYKAIQIDTQQKLIPEMH